MQLFILSRACRFMWNMFLVTCCFNRDSTILICYFKNWDKSVFYTVHRMWHEHFSGPHHHSSRHLVTGMPDEVKSEPLSLSGSAAVSTDLSDPQMGHQQPEEEEVPSPNHIPRGPSPEPKIEDTECHRSQSAMWVSDVWVAVNFEGLGVLDIPCITLSICCVPFQRFSPSAFLHLSWSAVSLPFSSPCSLVCIVLTNLRFLQCSKLHIYGSWNNLALRKYFINVSKRC